MRLRCSVPLVAAAIVLGATTASAGAATLRADDGVLRYRTDEAATVTAFTDGHELVLVDSTATSLDRALPDECVVEPVDAGIGARCDARGPQLLRISTGDAPAQIAAADLPRRVALDVRLGDAENVVEGGAGDDRIIGGAGRDTLYGGPGDDLVVGGDGNDYVRGNGGDDDVRGGEGLNFIFGDGGNDVLRGGSSFEFFTAGRGDDVVYGGDGGDDIGLGAGDDIAYGGDGDDEIRGGSGADRIFAGAGDDLVRARDGEGDEIRCGAGTDVARVDAAELDEARRSCEKVRQADVPAVDPADQDTVD